MKVWFMHDGKKYETVKSESDGKIDYTVIGGPLPAGVSEVYFEEEPDDPDCIYERLMEKHGWVVPANANRDKNHDTVS